MITAKDAIQLVLSESKPLGANKIHLNKALGYYLFEAVFSPINMPPFRQSAMDGYALNLHEDTNYNLIDEVKAGDSHSPKLKQGEAIRIFTGAAVPDTANAVIMQERVIINGETITLNGDVKLNDNIRPLGEQVKKGAVALDKGTLLTPAAIGFLASLGITEISVYIKPSIAIVVTGNELAEPGTNLPYGKIYESNAIMLQSALNSLGHHNVSIHKVEDDYQSTYVMLNDVITSNDMVLVSGGISVGDYDFVGKALLELQVEQVFYKVKQKPGKPLFFGKKGNSTIFALPGNPAAALSCFYIYINLALQKMSGIKHVELLKSQLISASNHIKKGDRAQFLKASVSNDEVTVLEGQSSAMLQTFAVANALVYISEDGGNISIGDTVEVIHLPK